MKGFTVETQKIREGIACRKHKKGFWFVPIGEEGRGRTLTRVPVGARLASSLETERIETWNHPLGFGGSSGHEVLEKKIEDLTLFECGVIRTKEKRTLLVVEGQPEDKRALVKLYCYEGFRGSNSYELGEGVTELARGTYAQGTAGRVGDGDEILAIMEPGSKIKASRTGRTYGDPKEFVYLFAGDTIEIMTPEEEVECIASFFQDEGGEYV